MIEILEYRDAIHCFMARGLTPLEAQQTWELCVAQAHKVRFSAGQLAGMVADALVNDFGYYLTLKKDIMEMDNNEPLVITSREFQEINFALEYNERHNHGTDGHNRLNLIAKFARHLGFERGSDEIPRMATVPPGVVINDGPTTGMQTAGR